MRASRTAEPRPEAMADVPGVCELPLTRAVVLYRDVHEIDHPGGRIQDIGMAVVVEGRFASSARVLDLGSGLVKYLDLSTELVVLDWVYDPTLAHLRFLGEGAEESGDRGELIRYCNDLGFRVLNRAGFNPLTRSTILRIGFRDICRDLDLHDGTSVRIDAGDAGVVRVHLDYDQASLVVRCPAVDSNQPLEEALLDVFPGLDIQRVQDQERLGSLAYHVCFGVPVDLKETHRVLGRIRRGLNHMVARFEPDRFEALSDIVETFGERGSLNRLAFREPREQSEPLHRPTPKSGTAIH